MFKFYWIYYEIWSVLIPNQIFVFRYKQNKYCKKYGVVRLGMNMNEFLTDMV